MNRVAYIVAAAAFAALLIIVSAPGGMAAQPAEEMGTSMGPPQGSGRSFQGAPSQMQQGFSQGSQQMQPSGDMSYRQPAQSGSPGQQGYAGGEGIVIGVDQPGNCLRIRKGPSSQYEQVGCANMGEKLRLTGVFSNDNRWAQLDNNSWVFVCQIKTDLRPPSGSFACGTPRRVGSSEIWSGPAGYYGGDFGPSYFSGGSGPYWYGHKWRHHGHRGHHGGGHHKK